MDNFNPRLNSKRENPKTQNKENVHNDERVYQDTIRQGEKEKSPSRGAQIVKGIVAGLITYMLVWVSVVGGIFLLIREAGTAGFFITAIAAFVMLFASLPHGIAIGVTVYKKGFKSLIPSKERIFSIGRGLEKGVVSVATGIRKMWMKLSGTIKKYPSMFRKIGFVALGSIVIVAVGGIIYLIFPQIPTEEHYALEKLGYSSSLISPCRRGWTQKGTVRCDDEFYSISAHVIYFRGRADEIPAEISKLSHLETLIVTSEGLTEIPPELYTLSSLKRLNLANNQLSGHLSPEFSKLVNLRSLILSNNEFDGAIPDEFRNLSNLRFFYFDDTYLCEPQDATFQEWLSSISELKRTWIPCSE